MEHTKMWTKICYIGFYLLLAISIINGFYMHLTEISENGKQKVLDVEFLQIDNSKIDDDGFPLDFFLKFSLDHKQIILKFSKDDNGFLAGVFTVDNGQINELSKKDRTHCHYTEENGNGAATLIINETQDNSTFRIMAILQIDDVKGYFTILPIKVASKDPRKKRDNTLQTPEIQHILSVNEERPISFANDFILIDNITIPNNMDSQASRKKRGTIQPVNAYVELLVAADYSIYKLHEKIANTTDKNMVLMNMKVYFAHLIYAVNLRYQNSLKDDPDLKITVKLSNYLFATTPEDSPWSLNVGVSGTPSYNGLEVINGDSALTAFRNYMNYQNTIPFTYDVAAAFVDKDMWKGGDNPTDYSRSGLAGLAYVGAQCGWFRYSIQEEHGGFGMLQVDAHELGHNLGAWHDGSAGYSDDCLVSSNYIMAPSAGYSNALNLFSFSPCSIRLFKSNLLTSDYSDLKEAAKCLSNIPTSLPVETAYPEMNKTGNLLSPNDICKSLYGSEAVFCPRPIDQDINTCTGIMCRKNLNDQYCWFSYGVGAPEGFPCDFGKSCSVGRCVDDPGAPQTCIHGNDVISQYYLNSVVSFDTEYVTCDKAISTLIANGFDHAFFCQFDSFQFKAKCCLTCPIYNTVECIDTLWWCSYHKSYCYKGSYYNDGRSVEDACPFTCGKCKRTPMTCPNTQCQNGGLCSNLTTIQDPAIGFECVCQPGYSGVLCEIKDPCIPNRCLNGGTCMRFGSKGFMCVCTDQCNGVTCGVCNNTGVTSTDSSTVQMTSSGQSFTTQTRLFDSENTDTSATAVRITESTTSSSTDTSSTTTLSTNSTSSTSSSYSTSTTVVTSSSTAITIGIASSTNPSTVLFTTASTTPATTMSTTTTNKPTTTTAKPTTTTKKPTTATAKLTTTTKKLTTATTKLTTTTAKPTTTTKKPTTATTKLTTTTKKLTTATTKLTTTTAKPTTTTKKPTTATTKLTTTTAKPTTTTKKPTTATTKITTTTAKPTTTTKKPTTATTKLTTTTAKPTTTTKKPTTTTSKTMMTTTKTTTTSVKK